MPQTPGNHSYCYPFSLISTAVAVLSWEAEAGTQFELRVRYESVGEENRQAGDLRSSRLGVDTTQTAYSIEPGSLHGALGKPVER